MLSPFAEVGEFTIQRFDGAGLGLSICKELADLMGGKVVVESALGVGSVFFLDLPAGRGPGATPCYASHGIF
ncbi:MAG: ATP-binding protein [Alphaproteobacteria bacterium]|nr:ATP-binding protein [Alphaproteobacteria bacterium]